RPRQGPPARFRGVIWEENMGPREWADIWRPTGKRGLLQGFFCQHRGPQEGFGCVTSQRLLIGAHTLCGATQSVQSCATAKTAQVGMANAEDRYAGDAPDLQHCKALTTQRMERMGD